MAKKLRFSCSLKAKAPGAVTCTALVPALDVALVEIFTGPAPIDWTQEATMVKVRIFFFTSEGLSRVCMIVILPTFWRSAPALKFSWQLTRNVSLATMLVYSYRQSLDEDGRSLWVATPRSSFTASSVVNFFSPGAPVTSFLCQPISTAIPVALAFNKTKPALSSIAVVSKAFKGTASTSLCRIWEHPQRSFPPFGQKPRESSKNCFLNEQSPREQAAINELTKKTPRKHATTTTSVAGLWQMPKTKLRLDVYIRPWPPGWSFLRRIYTSRGSERVNTAFSKVEKYRFLPESKGCTAKSLVLTLRARARDDGCTSRRWGFGTAFSHALTHQD